MQKTGKKKLQKSALFSILLGEIFRNVHFFFQNFCPEEKIFRKWQKNARFSDFWRARFRDPSRRSPQPKSPDFQPKNPFFRGFGPPPGNPCWGLQNPVFQLKIRLFPDFRPFRLEPAQIHEIPDFRAPGARNPRRHRRPVPNPTLREPWSQISAADEPGPPEASSDSSSTESPSVGGLADPTISSALLARRRRLHRRRSRRAHSSSVVGDPVAETRLVSLADLSVPVGDYRDDRSRRAGSALPILPRRAWGRSWFLCQLR